MAHPCKGARRYHRLPPRPGQLTLRLYLRSTFGAEGLWLILKHTDRVMTTISGGVHGGNEIGRSPAGSTLEADLALLAASPFVIGSTPIGDITPSNARPLWVRFEQGGTIHNRAYRSGRSWRVRVTFAVREKQPIRVLEMDEWGRLKSLFPTEVCARLKWNAAFDGDPAPVARFYDPNGHAEMLLLRCRCDGHAMDVIHNLSDGSLLQQSVWVVDILRLNPLLGIKLVRDQEYSYQPWPVSGDVPMIVTGC
jgi:hypothetical protein